LLNKYNRLVTEALLVLILASSTTACGFRLRGAVVIPPELQETHIEGVAEFSGLYREFKKVLTSSGASLIKDSKTAKSLFKITGEEFKRRVLTVDAQGRVAEYELIYRFNFNIVTVDGKTLVPMQKIEINRDYRFDPDNVLAKDVEEAQIRKEMVSFAVRQAMRRINAILKSQTSS